MKATPRYSLASDHFCLLWNWCWAFIVTSTGTKTAVFINCYLMLAAGLVCIIDNPWAQQVAACWLLAYSWVRPSNFGLSAIVAVLASEDFPSLLRCTSPWNRCRRCLPLHYRQHSGRFTYNGAFCCCYYGIVLHRKHLSLQSQRYYPSKIISSEKLPACL